MTAALLLLAAMSLPARAAVGEAKVVLVVIDGVRDIELRGEAKDDDGRRVPAESLFPNLLRLKERGLFLPGMRIDNPAGVSLPAYADIFAGRRQEKIVSNDPPKADFRSHYPTLFDAVSRLYPAQPDSVAFLASWGALCRLASFGGVPFFKSCGWEPGRFFKPDVYGDARSDEDTIVELLHELSERRPRLVFVDLNNADEEAHLQHAVLRERQVSYGIFHYHQALRASDYYVGRIWKALQADPFYKDSTYLVVTTDHGRDNYPDPAQWWHHGYCLRLGHGSLCSGCRHVFGLIVGPGVPHLVSNRRYRHTDLAPTIARLLGARMPWATGRPIAELDSIGALARK